MLSNCAGHSLCLSFTFVSVKFPFTGRHTNVISCSRQAHSDLQVGDFQWGLPERDQMERDEVGLITGHDENCSAHRIIR